MMYFFEVGYSVCESNLQYEGPSPLDSVVFSPNCNGDFLSTKNKEQIDFAVFPNPCSNSVNFNFEKSSQIAIRIFDARGQEVLREKVRGETISINVSAWSQGVYFVSLETEQGIAVKKMVVD